MHTHECPYASSEHSGEQQGKGTFIQTRHCFGHHLATSRGKLTTSMGQDQSMHDRYFTWRLLEQLQVSKTRIQGNRQTKTTARNQVCQMTHISPRIDRHRQWQPTVDTQHNALCPQGATAPCSDCQPEPCIYRCHSCQARPPRDCLTGKATVVATSRYRELL